MRDGPGELLTIDLRPRWPGRQPRNL